MCRLIAQTCLDRTGEPLLFVVYVSDQGTVKINITVPARRKVISPSKLTNSHRRRCWSDEIEERGHAGQGGTRWSADSEESKITLDYFLKGLYKNVNLRWAWRMYRLQKMEIVCMECGVGWALLWGAAREKAQMQESERVCQHSERSSFAGATAEVVE